MEVGGVGVAVYGGEEREGEDIIHVDEGVEGWGVVWVDDGVHNGVGDGRDEVPAKWWAEETDVEKGASGRDDGEDEGV